MLCWTVHTSRANIIVTNRGEVSVPLLTSQKTDFQNFQTVWKVEQPTERMQSGRDTPENTNTDLEDLGAVQWSDSLNRFKLWCLTFPIWGLLFAVSRFLHKQRGLRPLHRPAVQTVNIPAKTQNNIGGKALQSESLTLFPWQAIWGILLVPSFIYSGLNLFWQTVCLWN